MSRLLIPVIAILAFAGCQRAVRYPPAPAVKAAKEKAEPKAIWGWLFPETPPRDLPIRFVASDDPSWRSLPTFWNHFPPLAAGMRTSHIGQSPLGVVAGFALLENADAITIKVPRGLPDPTPLIPASNPPTYGKWRLGKKIFFDRVLSAGKTSMTCADCHRPGHGFAEASPISIEGTRNTLSLLNVVYNREQFWDGRVRSLEEVLLLSLDDEVDAESDRLKVLQAHRWGGVARRIDQNDNYRVEFRLIFGIERVTQDAIAKALATYMRTILSADSIYDRACAEAEPTKNATPSAGHFTKSLDDAAMKRLAAALPPTTNPLGRDQLAQRIEQGQAVFLGKGGCALCHPPGAFTNHQFYNALIGDSGLSQAVSGGETGRFKVLPIGLKDPAMRGAYRTPTLRNLSATGPYFHDGSRSTSRMAIDYFAMHLDKGDRLLAEPLRDLLARTPPEVPGTHPSLFNQDEGSALMLFLLALDGQPVDPIVANP